MPELKMSVKIENTLEMITVTDQELAARACDGCRSSFDELVQRYSQKVFKFIFMKTNNIECTEDIVQDAFVRAWQNIEKYDPQYCFSTWLYTIAIRLTHNHFRKRKINCIEDEILDSRSGNQQTPDQIVSQAEENQRVWKLAADLKPEYYNILWLKYVELLSIEEIAKATGKSEANVKVILHRARNKLAKKLN